MYCLECKKHAQGSTASQEITITSKVIGQLIVLDPTTHVVSAVHGCGARHNHALWHFSIKN